MTPGLRRMGEMNGEIRCETPLRRDRHDRGQSLVEMAIALPILLAVVIGIFEFGRAWNVRQVITNSAREGARVLALPQVDADSARVVVTNYMSTAELDPDLATMTINKDPEQPGGFARVGVSYPYQFQFLGPIVALLQGPDTAMQGTVQLQTTAVMRNE